MVGPVGTDLRGCWLLALALAALLVGCQIHQSTQRELDVALGRTEVSAGEPGAPRLVRSVDPRFAAAARRLTDAVERLPRSPENVDEPALHAALERLADAIEAVPAAPEVKVGLGDAAAGIRAVISQMPFGVEDRRGRLPAVEAALSRAAWALFEVARRSYPTSTNVRAAVDDFVSAAAATEPAALPSARRAHIVEALRKAERALAAIEEAAR